MKQKYLLIFVVVLALLALAACGGEEPTEVPAEAPTEAPVEEPTEAPVEEPVVELFGDPLRGGLIYDKWWDVTGADAPEADHPLWATQSTNERSGDDTWRCKECHGWDYSGADGAYGSGSHFTGFTGILDLAGDDPNEILAMLMGSTNPDHDFSTVMDEQALTDLALFVREEMADAALFVNDDKVPISSDVALGEELFEECSDCHGPEGLAVNFGKFVSDPEYVSAIAAGNPWEFIHKISFGQPGTEMISTVDAGWTVEEQAALLAYAQTLPEFPPVASGGQLYDKWWKALDIDAPEGDMPLWATQDTNERSGADTWRCKECHGWDYAGADGAYGSGSHFTGFSGVLEASGMSAGEIIAWLDGTTNADHDFSPYMDEATMQLLAVFIQDGLYDPTLYINADKTVNGEAAAGEALFEECAECHGDDGKQINFGDDSDPEYVGTIAIDNPWEFLHKAVNGQPGTHMIQGREMGWSLEELVNILSYAQTLPAE
jgi:mono/diheme cytochrome c family protein/predicted small lipoprotein YifL/ribosomal protein L37AE/L43A